MYRLSILFCLCLLVSAQLRSQTVAPGGPGNDAYWATAAKQGIGTSATLESKVWFTLADGVMTEVYYPDVTTANVHMLEFVVFNTKTKKVETEKDDSTGSIDPMYGLTLRYEQRNKAKSGEWEIRKTYWTDTKRNTVLISMFFLSRNKDLKPFLYYDPSINNTGMHDTAWAQNGALVASDGNKTSALVAQDGFGNTISNGFLGTSDGFTQLRDTGIVKNFARAENGNVVQFADFRMTPKYDPEPQAWTQLTQIALSFGKNANEAIQTASASLKDSYVNSWYKYDEGWRQFLKTLPQIDRKYQNQFNMAAMVLKAQEDKTVRGANVASLTIPWGGGKNANEDVGGGYHLVWARDLYEVFTAYMALGDKAAANRALDFLFDIQQKPDGSFPQNSWLDGRNGWGGLQMDEVGYPLIMAWQLARFDKQTFEKHIKPAADFIVKNGPTTPQERWEEKGGYSPSTIAAEIAGLVCAADIAKRNGDQTSADRYLKTADDWQANIEKWTATTTGPYGDGNYYLRLTQGRPDAGEKIELNNGAGTFKENEIVDAGFLELVRLGIKPANDPLIAKSVKVVDQQIKVDTPNGAVFYRYSHDGYGEMDDGRRWNFDGKYTGKGRPWPLLSGECGQYELAQFADAKSKEFNPPTGKSNYKAELQRSSHLFSQAQSRLDAMLGFANEGLMIPEQVWDKKDAPANRDREFVPELKFGEGTGSATPLAWSMAQFIRLAMNLKAGKNLDTPQVVYDRYVNTNGQKSVAGGQNQDVVIEQSEFPIDGPDDDCNADKEAYWNERSSIRFPLVKKCADGTFRASFAYSGDAKEVQIAGDFSGWKPFGSLTKPEPSPERTKFNRTRYISLEFKPSARVEYKLIVDGKWITDPLNPNKINNGVGGENSVLEMPDYKPTEWDRGIEITGKLESVEIDSKVWSESRKIQVYVPQIQGNVQLSLKRANPMYPVMYVQDGSDYIKRAKAIQIQENLVKAGKVKPFIVVFLDPKNRNKEYWASDDYAKFLAEEVVPFIDSKYRTIHDRDGRAILGASLGGVTSFWTAIKYPDVFGRIGGQSSSFWIDDRRVLKELANLDAAKIRLRFYLDSGDLEGTRDTEEAAKILRDKGLRVDLVTSEAGHNWTAWRDRLADAFVALWS